MKKAQKGNKNAFLKLFQMCEADIYRMAFVYMKNEQDALDIVQETAYKAFDKIETLKEPAYFKTWLVKIAISSSLNRLKQQQRSIPIQDDQLEAPSTTKTDATLSLLLKQLLDELTTEGMSFVMADKVEVFLLPVAVLAI
ncbi:sigma-70 family RNA polymerase sigma factor [Sporosarcina sp. Te-1]|nr:sigma-70 family RNA polymerase sigma factor [Sporosarcina sp. Te-1]